MLRAREIRHPPKMNNKRIYLKMSSNSPLLMSLMILTN